MKIYNYLLFILCIIVISVITFFFYLYKQDRLIILYKKNQKETIPVLLSNKDKLFGILIQQGIEKKIPLSFSFDTFNKNHPEEYIYNSLYQFFHYVNLENIGKMSFDLNHVSVWYKNIIINGRLQQTDLSSPLEEFLFLKSVFLTTKNIFPLVEAIYFYDDEKTLRLNHILPFFTTEMVSEKNSTIDININKNNISDFQIILTPYCKGKGNLIDDIFEKNIYQKYESILFLPKHEYDSDLYFKEINQLDIEKSNKIIVFISFQYANNEHIDIVHYSVIPENEICYTLESYPLPKKNSIIENVLTLFKKEFSSLAVHSFPFIPIINVVYPALYLVISVDDKNKVESILKKIKAINLNS